MDDRNQRGNAFLDDDVDEFDLLLEDDDFAPANSSPANTHSAVKQRRGAGTGARGRIAGAMANGRPQITVNPDWSRIAAFLFVSGVVVLVFWFAISSIAQSRKQGSYENYFASVSDVTTSSTAQGEELETILNESTASDSSQRLARIEKLADRAAGLTAKAEALEAPDEMTELNAEFVQALQYRQRGTQQLQKALTSALGSNEQKVAAQAVADANERLVASDVIYEDSYASEARLVLQSEEINDVKVPESQFVTNPEFTSVRAMTLMLERLRSAPASNKKGQTKVPNDGKVRGGQLEAGSLVVSPSGKTLSLTDLNEITGAEGITFEVPFTNQGEVQLTDVPVQINITGGEGDPIKLTSTIDVVDPGQTVISNVTLSSTPTFGEVLKMNVKVGPIPGEKTADNNAASYQIQFAL